jgi:16S rRNA (adenine1518-N6/adenine1519-N6)-dimethyltransferase
MTQPKTQLGQHWLKSQTILNKIVDEAGVIQDDVVLEIGPGLGTLTQVLINKGAAVTAVEFDQFLATSLANRVNDPAKLLEVKQQDILRFNLNELPKGYKIVANIPYYLTSALIRVLCDSNNPPTKAALLVQKEVAERVAAKPSQMSILSVITQMYYQVNLGTTVPAKFFTPPPKVDSRVLILTKRPKPLFGNQDPANLFRLVKAGFSERRKKIRNSLAGGMQIEKEAAEKLLKKADIDGELRAQNLSLDDWLKLTKLWQA